MPNAKRPRVLVTGGDGFLGRALLRELGKPEPVLHPAEIRIFDLNPSGGAANGVVHLRGDVRDARALREACAGVDVVFHLAALIDWNEQASDAVREVNVDGTNNVIEACRAAGVPALVFTSSLDAIYSGGDMVAVDETTPYPARFPNAYCSSKAEAEQAVLAANGAGLRTIVLRPCAIWGEGDPYHIGNFLKLARGAGVPRMGRARAPYQFVYVGNIAHALLLAARALLEGRDAVAGQLFFITDFPPQNIFDHMEPFVRAGGGRMLPPALTLPQAPMRALAWVIETAARALRPIWATTPLLTPFSVDSACSQFTVTTDKAERLLGYRPVYGEDEATRRTIEYVRTHRA